MDCPYWMREWRSVVSRDINTGEIEAKIDFGRHRYPYAIVWTPIPPITWFLPFIGHMGICDSRGVIMDFTGMIGVDNMAFGNPARYLILDPKKCHASVEAPAELPNGQANEGAAAWDAAVCKANSVYEDLTHCMLFGHDCHSHVGKALNSMKYLNFGHWNKVVLAAWIFFCGRHVGIKGVISTWIGVIFMIIIAVVIHLF